LNHILALPAGGCQRRPSAQRDEFMHGAHCHRILITWLRVPHWNARIAMFVLSLLMFSNIALCEGCILNATSPIVSLSRSLSPTTTTLLWRGEFGQFVRFFVPLSHSWALLDESMSVCQHSFCSLFHTQRPCLCDVYPHVGEMYWVLDYSAFPNQSVEYIQSEGWLKSNIAPASPPPPPLQLSVNWRGVNLGRTPAVCCWLVSEGRSESLFLTTICISSIQMKMQSLVVVNWADVGFFR